MDGLLRRCGTDLLMSVFKNRAFVNSLQDSNIFLIAEKILEGGLQSENNDKRLKLVYKLLSTVRDIKMGPALQAFRGSR